MQKVILVSGGNRGIGLEICRELAEGGHNVIMGTRDLAKGKLVAREIGQSIDVQQLDVTNEEQVTAIALYISMEYSRLDVLINNAGIGIGSNGAIDVNLAEVKKIMETNFYGPWRLTQALLSILNNSEEGRIVNISSGMGALDNLTGGYAGYRMSKSSLNALTILMANELSGSSVKVNSMCPGWVKTDMGGAGATRSVEQGADTAVWLALEKEIPHGKFLRDRKIISW